MKRNSKAASPSAMKYDQYKEKEGEDKISKLPVDILMSIISRLTLKEAVITTVLSTQWRHLSNYITHLRFDAIKPQNEINDFQHFQANEFRFCIHWFNTFLDKYKGCLGLQEFTLRIPSLPGVDIDKWCEFALSKKVEILDIKLHYYLHVPCIYHSLSVEALIHDKSSRRLVGLMTLKTLSLCLVHVDDRGVEILLSNCRVLENLSIKYSRKLKNVSVVRRSNMKHLNLEGYQLKSIQIRDMINLVSFKHRGAKIDLVMENVPKLIKIDAQVNTFRKQIQQLIGERDGPQVLPPLIYLKHMVLEINMSQKNNPILMLIILMAANPLLQKLEIKFFWAGRQLRSAHIEAKTSIQTLGKITKKLRHWNLRTVEFSGYLGTLSELDFIFYIFRTARKLEQIVVRIIPSDRIGAATAAKLPHLIRQQFQVIAPESDKLVIL